RAHGHRARRREVDQEDEPFARRAQELPAEDDPRGRDARPNGRGAGPRTEVVRRRGLQGRRGACRAGSDRGATVVVTDRRGATDRRRRRWTMIARSRTRVRDSAGRETRVDSRRLVSMHYPPHAAIDYRITPENWDGELRIR